MKTTTKKNISSNKRSQSALYTASGITSEWIPGKLRAIQEMLQADPSLMLSHEDSFYIHSSDPLALLHEHVNVEGRDVACVGGSGNFAQLFLEKGAESLYIFDVSPFAAFWTELRLCATAWLSYEEYKTFFGRDGLSKRKNEKNWDPQKQDFIPIPLFDRKLYAHICEHLSDQARTCFDTLLTPEFATLFFLHDKRKYYFSFARPRDFDFVEDVITSEQMYERLQSSVRTKVWSIHIEGIDQTIKKIKNIHTAYISNIGRTLKKCTSYAQLFSSAGVATTLFTVTTTPEAHASQKDLRYFLDKTGVMQDRQSTDAVEKEKLHISHTPDEGRFEEIFPGNTLLVNSCKVEVLAVDPQVYFGALLRLHHS